MRKMRRKWYHPANRNYCYSWLSLLFYEVFHFFLYSKHTWLQKTGASLLFHYWLHSFNIPCPNLIKLYCSFLKHTVQEESTLGFLKMGKLSGVIAFLSPEDGACPNTCHETQLHRRKKRKKKESSPYSVRSSQEMCKRRNWRCEEEASLCCGHGRERDLESTGKVPHYSKC